MRAAAVAMIVFAACHPDRRPPPVPAPSPAADSATQPVAGPVAPPVATPAPSPILGFRDATAERAREETFLATPTSAATATTITETSSAACMAGTSGASAVADYLAQHLTDLGFEVTTTSYDVYLPFPKKLALTVGGKPLSLVEPYPEHAAAAAPVGLQWNAYSANGTVTAPIVYAGYGRDADFDALAKAGVDPKRKIALLRYGPLYRGAQVASAERHGAAGVIFYSDVKDEPRRPTDSVQRGTVVYYWQYTGDPLTPGTAATADAQRAKTAEVLPKIPVLAITADEAAHIHAAMKGPEASGDLAGAPGASVYHLGPGPRATLTVELDGKTRTIRDVVARLPGASEQTVMLGNHYDGWVYGALDPHSGTATLLEIARGLAALAKTGWKPQRTIALGFWDAEEFGVIGSTEWVEDPRSPLDALVAYFNIDTIKSGALVIQGAPELRDHLTACAGEVTDPNTGKPFAPTFKDIGIGSDWTAFLHHAGVPSMMWQTGAGKGTYDVWHSIRDDYEHVTGFSDPDLAFIPTYAKAMGLCALRLAEADALPFHWSARAAWLRKAIDDLSSTTKLAIDRDKLASALDAFEQAARRAEAAPGSAACNAALPKVERAFLAPDGLVARPWYRNLTTGPNADNGYGALLVPELAAAKDQAALDRAVARVEVALQAATAALAPCVQ